MLRAYSLNRKAWRRGLLACTAVATLAAVTLAPAPALAQTMSDRLSRQQSAAQTGRLFVEAEEVVYDNDNNRVEARGNVQLYYGSRSLEANRVIYDRGTRRVFAQGNVKLTEANGQVTFAERFELTDDFRDGFIDSVRVRMPDGQRFSAQRGERAEGETTVFERGTYTSCEPCKDNPERPPLWQVKAARIISKNSEQMIYYENATLEFYGIPVAFIPFFSSPDPSVTRKSGFLAPRAINKTALGYGVTVPYYWAIAPNMDILFSPTFLSRQGFLGRAEFRHRLEHGEYNIRAAGIFQNEPEAFLPSPSGAGNKDFRGVIETNGRFLLSDKFKFGWNIAATSDKYFLSNYSVPSETVTRLLFRESTSQVYLNGQGERSWFDLRGFYFRSLYTNDWQKQTPIVHPVFDFERRWDAASLGLGRLGGEFGLTVNFTSLTREAAQFNDLPTSARFWTPARLGASSALNVYEGCAVYEKGRCILRGIAGNHTRLSTIVSWRRQMVDQLGQVWTPFASAQVDAIFYRLNTKDFRLGDPTDRTLFGNQQQLNFLDNSSEFLTRFMPAIGLEYRYPFVASTSWATHVIEPIAQIIARPDETRIGSLPNEDAHSIIFDDTTLFSVNKFSGFDRTEGGVRANVGAQYRSTFSNGGSASLLVGQSYHLAGRNSFARGDLINTGLNSGLETRRSDYVGRIGLRPLPAFGVTARGRFDENTFALRRLEVTSDLTIGPARLFATYARHEPQPETGRLWRQEGLATGGTVQLPRNWFASGSVLFDLDRYIQDRALALSTSTPANPVTYNSNRFRVVGYNVGIGYQDECTTFSFHYGRGINESIGAKSQTTQTFLVRLELRHLGELGYQQRTGPESSLNDGFLR
jgi:LPS-assembly protein